MKENTTNGVAWTALVIAIIALILGWTAFNRAGADLGDMIQQEVEKATEEIEKEYQEAEREVREETSDALFEAGADVSTDEDPNNAGE